METKKGNESSIAPHPLESIEIKYKQVAKGESERVFASGNVKPGTLIPNATGKSKVPPTSAPTQLDLAENLKKLATLVSERNAARESQLSPHDPGKGDVKPNVAPPKPMDVVREHDRLTERLKRAEQYLAIRLLKAEASVEIDASNKLAFVRKHAGWRLVWQHTEIWYGSDPKTGQTDLVPSAETTETDLSDCSIQRKAQIAELLPSLMAAIDAEAKRRLEAAQRGNAAMDAFEKLVGIGAETKEGK